MRKKYLIQLGITGILVIVLIFALGNAFKKSRRLPLQDSKDVLSKKVDLAGIAANQAKGSEGRGLYGMLEQQAKLIDLKRDPFTAVPIVIEKNMQSGVNLTGILWDKDKPLAIIDGNVVKKGNRVGDKQVVDIKRDRIILSDGGELFEVKLKQ